MRRKHGRHAVDLRLDVAVYEVVALGYKAYVFAVLLDETSGLDSGRCAVYLGGSLTATALIGCSLRTAVYDGFKQIEHTLRYGIEVTRLGGCQLILLDGVDEGLLKFCGKHGYGLAPSLVKFRCTFHNIVIGLSIVSRKDNTMKYRFYVQSGINSLFS